MQKQGWKYSGIANYYVPIERATREETVANVYGVIASDERLKKYSPRVISNTAIEFCSLGEIDLHCMENPKGRKYRFIHCRRRLYREIFFLFEYEKVMPTCKWKELSM